MAISIRALHYPLVTDSGGNQLQVETDYERYVAQLIEQVLLTNPGERIDKPEFGAGVSRLVHSPISSTTASLAQSMIYNALTETLADLIRVDEVAVSSVDSQLDINIRYTLYAMMQQRLLNLEVTA